ncbi:kelch-like protein 6 isoform X1 [Gadus chalcogrammus]|uniref:kelch-like protein 6 isoform X1 n=1 Tax=Gadus chalcogrammus TaxID=1042646 RepID=UPI0024C4DAB8|nr:kelch-like protein 6 isoform X1 [Gadus chalcogrammus]
MHLTGAEKVRVGCLHAMAVHYFLVCPILLLLTLVAVEALQYGRRGSETTLVPQIRGAPDAILWNKESRKVVEFDGSEESVQETFRDRVVLDWHAASLIIKDLRLADSGTYELEATINKKKYYSQHEVVVIEKVATPTISCLINGTVGGVGESDPPRTRADLWCSAEGPPSLIALAWTPVGGVATKGAGLTVALAGDQDDTVYTCLASNPVSQEMGTFVAKDCYPDSFPTGGIVAVVVLCLLVVISAGCVLGYWRWSKAHPRSDGIEDVESRPLNRSNGSGISKAYGNRATLPSTQPLLHPPMGEDNTTHSGGGGDSTRVSVHPSESRLPDLQQPSDLESKLSAGDPPVSVLVEPAQGSESDLTAPQPMTPRYDHLGSDVGGHLGSEGGHLGSEEGSQAADADLYRSDPEAREPAAVVLREEEVYVTPRSSSGSLHGDKEEEKEKSKEEKVEPTFHTPRGSLDSLYQEEEEEKKKEEAEEKEEEEEQGEEEEEEEKKKKDTGVSPADEHGGERLVAAGEPPVNVVTQPSEEKAAVAGAPHGAEVLQEKGEAGKEEEDDGEEEGQGVSSPQMAPPPDGHSDSEAGAGERGTDGREEDAEETSHAANDKRDDAKDKKGKAVPPTGPDREVMRRREEENDVPGKSRDDPHGTKEDEGKDKGVASSPASKPESPQGSEASVGEGSTDRSTEEETMPHQDNAGDGAERVAPTVEPAVETPERKREDQTSHDDSDGQEEEESKDRGSDETIHQQDNAGDGAGQMPPPAKPAVKTPEGEREDVPQTSRDDAERPKEEEVEEEDGKDKGGASLQASTPETDVYSEAVAGEAITDTSMVDKKLDVESPVGKEKEDNVQQTVHDDAHVEEAEGVKEGGKTSLTEMESGPETGQDPGRQPGGSGAERGGTQGSGGQHEGRREETRDGPLPANHVEEGDTRDANKDAENEDGAE